ncbi:MAG: hypothetical protein AAF921_04045 [Cyanobacteria bacterium P01_D01_bin.44]
MTVNAKYSVFCVLNLLVLNLLGACTPLADTDAPTAQETTLALPSISRGGKATSIETLRQDPKPDQPVELEGIVRQRVPLLEGWIYELEDETGRIWVLTEASEPALDETARVSGTVQYEQILIGDVDIGEYYLQEKDYSPLTEAE